MKTLFIDDDVFRFDRMVELGHIPPDSVHVDNGLKAIDAIVDDGPWCAIFFDHDLATFVADHYPREITGNDVARVLARMDWKPLSVVIHSTNPVGASNIRNTLADAGIGSTIKPFWSFMENENDLQAN